MNDQQKNILLYLGRMESEQIQSDARFFSSRQSSDFKHCEDLVESRLMLRHEMREFCYDDYSYRLTDLGRTVALALL